jgi:hypothetical protein
MDISAIKNVVKVELARGESFTNFHGITPATICSFLVEPFTVRTDPDDSESQPRDMWVVLQEQCTPTLGYVVVYDPTSNKWGVAENASDASYTLVVSASSLAGALNSM